MRAAIFLITFALYVFTAYPSVAPYRDAGEMTTVAMTLGVAHPPGYPLYIISSNAISKLIPFGNPARKISVVSALFMAGAAVIFYSLLLLFMKNGTGALISGALALCFGFSYLNWYLAIVQEMYTMGVFMLIAALYFILTNKTILAFFILGLATGVRTDSILALPAFFIYLLKSAPSDGKKKISAVITSFLFFALGATIFLYSYVRANTSPLINWGDNSTIERLISSLMRRSHGGTLDLISLGYRRGENFADGIFHYLTHILRDYSGVPFLAAPLGIFYFFKDKKKLLLLSVVGWLVTGGFFIYLANMPPNPHALAILEAHYLFADVFLWFLSSGGFIYFYTKTKRKIIPCTLAVIALVAVFVSSATFTDGGKPIGFFAKRSNYILEDYARNIRVLAPPDSAIVVKEDVQVFTLWYEKYVLNKRPDITIVASGLSGSPWYHKMNENSGVVFTRLTRDENSWRNFIASNTGRKIFFTNDTDFPSATNIITEPHGLVNYVSLASDEKTLKESQGGPPKRWALQEVFCSFRLDEPRYKFYREFFTPDIIEDYAKGWHRLGFESMRRNDLPKSRSYFLESLYLNADNFPQAAFHLGWSYFSEGNFRAAGKYYNFAATLYERYLNLAAKYKAAPDLKKSIARETAEVWLHKGVVSERLSDDDNALYSYRRAAEISPELSTAYYNAAVIYWKKNDFSRAAEYLKRALQADPSNVEAKKYLSILQSKSPTN